MTKEELLAAGARAVQKGGCASVLVAPDHTGEDNYHNCSESKDTRHGEHTCGCSYVWTPNGDIVDWPAWHKGAAR